MYSQLYGGCNSVLYGSTGIGILDDDDFVARYSTRALQSLFRSSDGYDEELARVQRGETEDGDDLYD